MTSPTIKRPVEPVKPTVLPKPWGETDGSSSSARVPPLPYPNPLVEMMALPPEPCSTHKQQLQQLQQQQQEQQLPARERALLAKESARAFNMFCSLFFRAVEICVGQGPCALNASLLLACAILQMLPCEADADDKTILPIALGFHASPRWFPPSPGVKRLALPKLWGKTNGFNHQPWVHMLAGFTKVLR